MADIKESARPPLRATTVNGTVRIQSARVRNLTFFFFKLGEG